MFEHAGVQQAKDPRPVVLAGRSNLEHEDDGVRTGIERVRCADFLVEVVEGVHQPDDLPERQVQHTPVWRS